MNRAARVLSVVPIVAGLGWMSIAAVERGMAGTATFESALAMNMWTWSRIQPGAETLASIREDLQRAESIVPTDPATHELLGLVEARVGTAPEYASRADVHFVKALELRPTAAFTWVNLAAVRYRVGDTGRGFEAALENAMLLGAGEPEVQRTVANYGLAVWTEKGPTTQAAIEKAVALGMKRNPLEMLQIAERRGRLDVSCRHFAGSTRQIDPKWVQSCQSMEAPS